MLWMHTSHTVTRRCVLTKRHFGNHILSVNNIDIDVEENMHIGQSVFDQAVVVDTIAVVELVPENTQRLQVGGAFQSISQCRQSHRSDIVVS